MLEGTVVPFDPERRRRGRRRQSEIVRREEKPAVPPFDIGQESLDALNEAVLEDVKKREELEKAKRIKDGESS